jgi:hypothetical protein
MPITPAATFRPTTERASALLRGSEITCYFPRGYLCYLLSLGCGATVYNPMAATWHPAPTQGATARLVYHP